MVANASGENFPVALRLLPAAYRRHLFNLYCFARLTHEFLGLNAGMDTTESAYFGELLRRAHDPSWSILLVEHDVPLVLSVCHRIYVLEFGRLIATGTPAEIRGDERVRAAYFGASVA